MSGSRGVAIEMLASKQALSQETQLLIARYIAKLAEIIKCMFLPCCEQKITLKLEGMINKNMSPKFQIKTSLFHSQMEVQKSSVTICECLTFRLCLFTPIFTHNCKVTVGHQTFYLMIFFTNCSGALYHMFSWIVIVFLITLELYMHDLCMLFLILLKEQLFS